MSSHHLEDLLKMRAMAAEGALQELEIQVMELMMKAIVFNYGNKPACHACGACDGHDDDCKWEAMEKRLEQP